MSAAFRDSTTCMHDESNESHSWQTPGEVGVIHGLISHPQLNGAVGVLRDYNANNDRWDFTIFKPERMVQVRPVNLRPPTHDETPVCPDATTIAELRHVISNAIPILLDERSWTMKAVGTTTDASVPDAVTWYGMITPRERASANMHIHPVQLPDGRFVLPCVLTPHPNAFAVSVKLLENERFSPSFVKDVVKSIRRHLDV